VEVLAAYLNPAEHLHRLRDALGQAGFVDDRLR
jgi:hypothetical protein